jgi:hypothetical protein
LTRSGLTHQLQSTPGSKARIPHDPPQHAGSGTTAVRRLSDHLPKLGGPQPKNGLPMAFGPAQPLGGWKPDKFETVSLTESAPVFCAFALPFRNFVTFCIFL